MLHLIFLDAPSPRPSLKAEGVHAGYIPPKIRVNSEGKSKPLPKVEGYTPRERTDYILLSHGHDPDLRNRIAEEQAIKAEVLVAIARADSHLGHQKKSKNNVGNVGNNDRGDTIAFATLEDGIRAMGSMALNGRYLSHKKTIGELSCGGYLSRGVECQYPVYATSPENRNNNVLNLLSVIYGYNINEDFEFRN